MRLSAIPEGIGIALDAIGANKLRSGLTILGIVIGVSTVMAMASIVQGIRGQIFETLEIVGPKTFRVLRFLSITPLNPDALPREVRIRPVLSASEAKAIGELDEIHYSSIWVFVFERLTYGETRTQPVAVYGADGRFMEILGGDVTRGRTFTRAEGRAGAPVVVLEIDAAEELFGRQNPLGKMIRIGGKPFRVIGIYQEPENIFQPPGQEIGAIVPFQTAERSFRYDETNALMKKYQELL